MEYTKEIVLIFKKTVHFDADHISKLVEERFDELDNPQVKLNGRGNVNILYRNNKHFVLTVYDTNVSFLIDNEYTENKIEEIIFDLVDLFEEEEIKIVRIGYLKNIFCPLEDADKLRKKITLIDNSLDFNLSWFNEIKFEKSYLNCWQRLFTDGVDVPFLINQFDINTKTTEEVDLTMDFIKKFMNTSEKYIEKHEDFL